MDALQLFTRALENAAGHSYVSAITFVPLRMPAYKEFTFTLKQLDGPIEERKIYKLNYQARVTSDEERELVMQHLTEEFIAYVLKDIMKS